MAFARVLKLIPGKDGLVRTIKLKNQSSTLIRSLQSALPPEVSGNDWKSLQLQGVQPIECVKSPNPDSSEVNQARGPKYGRKVKKHVKLNLLTTRDVYEWLSSSSKTGGPAK
ncbi:integrase catalytic domain-containing protein [Nephila pilipes]|uniref:Integrase catalytic domain-containing protein n=1 Tax=Nephila pilipes TaxID=299642 RepID=A0A8X6MT25_NEPPI|nr:integrase catalytic domain-containing protein [Nephila pilipes]